MICVRAKMDEEARPLTKMPEDGCMSIEAMEQRLQKEMLEGCLADASLCVWFACTDVCPPGG